MSGDSYGNVFPEWRDFLGSSSDLETQGFLRKVVKRSGEIADYDRNKIEQAIGKAILAVEGRKNPDKAASLTNDVEEHLRVLLAGRRAHSIPAIEEIQDTVENVLIENKEVEIAKAYILYRERHNAMRDAKNLMIDISKTMDGYLQQSDWRVNENANVNFSLGGLILHNSGTITANYWLKNIYPAEIAKAHQDCAFHIHDLSMFSGYCAGWSLRQLIKEGLGGVPDKITSKPASHLSTLVNQMVNFLGVLQNEWAGAQAFSSFDTYLAPFVKADNLSEIEVRQCIQSYLFGINTPSRWGSQAPFTNITLDWTCPADLKNEKAIVGGKEMNFTYGDCQKDPTDVPKALDMIRGIQDKFPIFGICLGHQLFAMANGATTSKMTFGHRGFNHAVREIATGRVDFTSQNHGYAVDSDSIDKTDLMVTHIEINDKSVEGVRHKYLPAFSVQFHPDAAPGPHDADYLFDEFMEMIDASKNEKGDF